MLFVDFLILCVYFTCVILCTELVYYCHQLEAILFLMILLHIDRFNVDLKYIKKTPQLLHNTTRESKTWNTP